MVSRPSNAHRQISHARNNHAISACSRFGIAPLCLIARSLSAGHICIALAYCALSSFSPAATDYCPYRSSTACPFAHVRITLHRTLNRLACACAREGATGALAGIIASACETSRLLLYPLPPPAPGNSATTGQYGCTTTIRPLLSACLFAPLQLFDILHTSNNCPPLQTLLQLNWLHRKSCHHHHPYPRTTSTTLYTPALGSLHHHHRCRQTTVLDASAHIYRDWNALAYTKYSVAWPLFGIPT